MNQGKGAQTFLNILKSAEVLFDRINKRRDSISSQSAVKDYQSELRRKFIKMIGDFPPRTPLNPRITGSIKRKGFTVEKLIFESRTGFLVTASIYLPRKTPAPGILFPCGHSQDGKACKNYQRAAISLALKGYVVLLYDPVSQGERIQYFNPKTGESRMGGCTTEHSKLGDQIYLSGINLANIRIWDGIRALDYLLSRPEVDSERIGCTGCSGGGTLTAYLSALDQRINSAVPVCYIHSRYHYLKKAEIADAEQQFHACIFEGLDHCDLLIMSAPRPVLICSAQKDFFPIEGTRYTYEVVKRFYGLLGFPQNIQMVEAQEEHGYSLPLRRAMYRWFNRCFGLRADGSEPRIRLFDENQLWATPEGQVARLGSRTVFQLQRDIVLSLPNPSTPQTAEELHLFRRRLRSEAEKLLGVGSVPIARQTRRESFKFKGLRFHRISLRTEDDIVLPGCIHEGTKSHSVLILHERGWKNARNLLALARAGYTVIALDPRGVGEDRWEHNTRNGYYSVLGTETFLAYSASMIGKTLLGMRATDVASVVELLASQGTSISLIGIGDAGLIALYAGLLSENVHSILAVRPLISYRNLALTEYYRHHTSIMPPYQLQRYDIPHLLIALYDNKVWLVNPVDGARKRVSKKALFREYEAVFNAFSLSRGEFQPLLLPPGFDLLKVARQFLRRTVLS